MELLSQLPIDRLEYAARYYSARGDLPENRAQFLPASLQQPRIPIWVGGIWPHRAPFLRAAKWDGVVPLRAEQETADDLRDGLAYIKRHRGNMNAFDVVVAGATSAPASPDETARHPHTARRDPHPRAGALPDSGRAGR